MAYLKKKKKTKKHNSNLLHISNVAWNFSIYTIFHFIFPIHKMLRLFLDNWLIVGTGTIECIRTDGVGRAILTDQAPYPFGLTFSGSSIYWSDWTM